MAAATLWVIRSTLIGNEVWTEFAEFAAKSLDLITAGIGAANGFCKGFTFTCLLRYKYN